MNLITAITLGLVQGFTEFLPISSSGHLVIFERLLGGSVDESLAFSVFLHFATLISVCIVYYKDIWQLITAFFSMIIDLFKGKPNLNDPYRRLVLLIIVGSIPAGVVGVLLKLTGLDGYLRNLLLVGICLFVTAIMMLVIDKIVEGKLNMGNTKYKTAFLIGTAQAFAILPGVSRSGSTITASVLLGLKKEFALKFSFLLSIPAILGAGLIELKDVFEQGMDVPANSAIAGFIAATVAGVLSIKILNFLLKSKKFYIFGIYCIIAGIVSIILFFL